MACCCESSLRKILTIALIAIFLSPLTAHGDCRLFFHWGDTAGISNMLYAAGYPSAYTHAENMDSGGSAELTPNIIQYLRDHYNFKDAVKGPGLYMSRDPLSSKSYGGHNPDLAVIEMCANESLDQWISAVPNQGRIEHDANHNPSAFEHYPLAAGPYEAGSQGPTSDYYLIYRTPNGYDRNQGVRILVRPPDSNDVTRIWDQMGGDSDQGKIKFLERISSEITDANSGKSRMSKRTKILFDRMTFDIGPGFLEHYLSSGQAHSMWNGEVLKPLLIYLEQMPKDPRSEKLFNLWRNLPGKISVDDLRAISANPDLVNPILKRDSSLLKSIFEAVLNSQGSTPEKVQMIIKLSPLVLNSPEKSHFLKELSPIKMDFLSYGSAELKEKHPEFFKQLFTEGGKDEYIQMLAHRSKNGFIRTPELLEWMKALRQLDNGDEKKAFEEIAHIFLSAEAYGGSQPANFNTFLRYAAAEPSENRNILLARLRETSIPILPRVVDARSLNDFSYLFLVDGRGISPVGPNTEKELLPILEDIYSGFPEIRKGLNQSLENGLRNIPHTEKLVEFINAEKEKIAANRCFLDALKASIP